MLNDNGDALNTSSATSPACNANATQRRREPDAVRELPARQRPEHRSDAEKDLILCTGDEASAAPARDTR